MLSCCTFFASEDPYLSHLLPGSLSPDGGLRLRPAPVSSAVVLHLVCSLLLLLSVFRRDGGDNNKLLIEEGIEAEASLVLVGLFLLLLRGFCGDALQSSEGRYCGDTQRQLHGASVQRGCSLSHKKNACWGENRVKKKKKRERKTH